MAYLYVFPHIMWFSPQVFCFVLFVFVCLFFSDIEIALDVNLYTKIIGFGTFLVSSGTHD